jgi:hypothetical protein
LYLSALYSNLVWLESEKSGIQSLMWVEFLVKSNKIIIR